MFYEITFSPTGGTKKCADLLSAAWKEKTEIDLMKRQDDFTKYTFTAEDICLVAVPSFGGRVPAVATERLQMMQGGGAKAILVVVYGNRAYEDTLVELEDTLTERGFVPMAGAAAVAEHSIFREFAAGRPDANDEIQLKDWSSKIKSKLEAGTERAMPFVGNRPYKKYGAIPMVPKAKSCQMCGKCVSICPVGAIPADQPNETIAEKCITCMACTVHCPKSARTLPDPVFAALEAKLSAVCAERKPNKLY